MTIGSFGKLQLAVKNAAEIIQDHFTKNDHENFFVQITVSNDRYDGYEVKYTVAKGKYDSNSVTGNELAPVVQEFLRRNGWDIAHNAKLIAAPVRKATVE